VMSVPFASAEVPAQEILESRAGFSPPVRNR
jgi:hypothetical protein